MAGVIESVKTNQGKEKVSLNGFLYCKDKRVGDKMYWRCEDRTCHGRLTTKVIDNGQYEFSSTKRHNHNQDPNRLRVIKATNEAKRLAEDTMETPTQIIQNVISCVNVNDHPYLSSENAQRKRILHARKRKLVQAEPKEITSTDSVKTLKIDEPD